MTQITTVSRQWASRPADPRGPRPQRPAVRLEWPEAQSVARTVAHWYFHAHGGVSSNSDLTITEAELSRRSP